MKNNEVVTVSVGEDENLECYVIIGGKEVRCSREVYLTIKRPGRKENKRQQRAERPLINGKRCQGDCENCCKYDGCKCMLAGEVSLDELPDDGSACPVDNHSVEEEVIANIMLQDMYRELEGDERCTEVFKLMVEEIPQREIAEQLEISDGTVTYYIKKIRKKLEKFNR